MNEELWTAVDGYIEMQVAQHDDALRRALEDSRSLPNIQVTAAQGKLLHVMVRALRAHRVLELGTLGGYSAIWMARALPPGGRLVTLEVNPEHARIAAANVERAGLGDVVEIRVGAALDTLRAMIDSQEPAFDLVFIDADKPPTADYFDLAVQLSHPSSVIVVDNVVRQGRIIDDVPDDAAVQGVRRFFDALSHDDRVTATAIQTVGAKGYDGFAIAVVNP
jgi:predicted O-methyltransferase YrrM